MLKKAIIPRPLLYFQLEIVEGALSSEVAQTYRGVTAVKAMSKIYAYCKVVSSKIVFESFIYDALHFIRQKPFIVSKCKAGK